ncbi:VWA domain-containing protein [Rhodobacteraceae bacterium NNCM2]|nr:VWA domain-containing protein [Coraliihabitans acroporae]
MEFAAPLALLLLLLPPIVFILAPPRQIRTGAVYLPPSIASRMLGERRSGARAQTLRWMPFLIWALLVVALAGPRQMETLDLVPASGRDIMLMIDLSGSMEKQDFDLDGERISRLEAVTRVAGRFVEGRVGDRIGLVVFGDKAYVAAPLTHDVNSVASVIAGAVIGISGKSTAISDGLGLGLKRLEASDAKSKVVILLSDGIDTTGDVAPGDTAEMAKEMGVRVHTIALGPDDLETAPRADGAVDAATLRVIAETSGGAVFRVRTMDELAAVAETIDQLEPSALKAPPLRIWRDYWVWPAAAGVALLALLLGFGWRELA